MHKIGNELFILLTNGLRQANEHSFSEDDECVENALFYDLEKSIDSLALIGERTFDSLRPGYLHGEEHDLSGVLLDPF